MDNQQNNEQQQQEESFLNIDFRKLLSDVIRLWWMFVISIAISIFCLYLYNRYTRPTYRTDLTLIIDQDGDGRASYQSQQNIIDGIMLAPGMRNIDNQIAILSSYTMINRIVEEMGIFISYYHKGNIADTECYPRPPFDVDMDSTHVQPLSVQIYVSIIDSVSYELNVKSERAELYNYSTRMSEGSMPIEVSERHRFGDPIITEWGAFTISLPEEGLKKIDNYYFRFENPYALTSTFHSGLKIIRDQETNSTVVTLSINGTNRRKSEDFLNQLAALYISDNLAQKNKIADNTIAFIESQLVSLSDTLDDIGMRLSNFRANHGLQQTATAKGNTILNELQGYERQIQEQQLFMTYYNYLEEYFSSDSILNGVIAPAVFDTKSPSIAQQLTQIMQLNSEKQAYQDTYGKQSNPASREVMAKLQIARSTLLRSIASHKNMTANNITELQAKEATCKKELMGLPETERIYLGIDRKFTLNNEVYTFLLRKRSESQIQKASNTPDHRVIDPAMTAGRPVAPNYQKNRVFAFALALAIPLLFIILRQMLDSKLRTPDDIKRIANFPIIGEIPNNKRETPFIVLKHPKSISAEAFRRMRSRIEFMVSGKKNIIIAISSSIPSEGKTFCSVNIASVFAINHSKTILLGFDLRKPGLSDIIDKDKDKGISNYIIGDCTLDETIIHYEKNFDIMLAGAIPPNPAELISSQQCANMMNELKERYDVIVIDTPPMSLVSDAYLLSRWADTLLFISRLDYTLKDALSYTVSTFEGEGIKNVGLVINDTNSRKSRYGYGRYGYGYGRYGYGRYGYGRYGYGKYGYGKYYGSKDDDKSNGYYTED
ncbi:MAG: polysaccharide biosynthesis tyrosine autokinase [Bacteroidales bacterium]|nr:polysaccharide biosynthesis tyrosine autokinase [Bacteroidales bacterium]